MASEIMGFLQQPIQVMAREGDEFSASILRTLRRWMDPHQRISASAEREGRMYVLGLGGASAWQIVLMQGDDSLARAAASVYAIEYGDSEAVATRFAPLLGARWIAPAIEVELARAQPELFRAAVEAMGEIAPLRATAHFAAFSPSDAVGVVDAAARHWASSKARGSFKELLDDALLQPQIVKRGGDDVWVMSRTYFEELVDPSSTRAMSQHFRNRGLSAAGLEELDFGELEPLADLPQLPSR